jgi:hypothetical protein
LQQAYPWWQFATITYKLNGAGYEKNPLVDMFSNLDS